MHILKDPDSHPEILEMLSSLSLIEFNSAYLSLANLLARLRRSTHSQIAFATPPGQTTVPENPNRSGGSTSSTSSGSSTESKLEPYAQNVATDFLKATYSTVVKWMTRFAWVNPNAKLYLSPQYVRVWFFWLLQCSPENGKYVSARHKWLKLLMMAAFPCTFNAIHPQVNNRGAW